MIEADTEAEKKASPELKLYRKTIYPFIVDLTGAVAVHRCRLRDDEWLSDIDKILKKQISEDQNLQSIIRSLSVKEMQAAQEFVNFSQKFRERWLIAEDVKRSCNQLRDMPWVARLDLLRTGGISEVAPRFPAAPFVVYKADEVANESNSVPPSEGSSETNVQSQSGID